MEIRVIHTALMEGYRRGTFPPLVGVQEAEFSDPLGIGLAHSIRLRSTTVLGFDYASYRQTDLPDT
jgi:hypothetical protein